MTCSRRGDCITYLKHHRANDLESLWIGPRKCSSWMHDWDFTPKLYIILEDSHRWLPLLSPTDRWALSPSELSNRSANSQVVVLDRIMITTKTSPATFKEAKPVVGGMAGDRFSFQAAHIAATLQVWLFNLMCLNWLALEVCSDDFVHFWGCNGGAELWHRRELLDGFANVPTFFLQPISSPLLHYLASIVAILDSVIERAVIRAVLSSGSRSVISSHPPILA